MKTIILLSVFLITISSCTEKDKKKDVELNTYYSKYKIIYENYEKYGPEKSIGLLDEYLEEFPNAIDAYIFKAWIYSQNDELGKIDELMEKAIDYDSTNLTIYSYWSSLLLLDSNNLEKAKKINDIGLNIDDKDLDLNTIKIWIEMFHDHPQNIEERIQFVMESDSTNNSYYLNTAIVSNIFLNNDSIAEFYFSKVDSTDKIFTSLEQFKKEEINLDLIYKEVIK